MPNRKDLANTIRVLSMDAVQKANSGHPGMPMGMADIAEVLWNDFLSHNPSNPHWPNRDRFVLSNGHGAMLLYSLLHLTGYDVSIDDLKQFRQLHSKTPGHPELGETPGVETTTGPLGQGLANGVGMAIAEQRLSAEFNRKDHNIIDHHTYVFVGDGCLMEGISHEACSLAGTLGLGKLIVLYDDNAISIDGEVSGWFRDNTPQRFAAYGWQVIDNIDGHDPEAIHTAITKAKQNTTQPTIICCKTQIGYGSPNLAGSEKSHGAPLGEEEIAATRKQLNWPHPPFEIPEDIQQAWNANERGKKAESNWQQQLAKYQQKFPELASELQRRLQGELPDNWQALTETLLSQCIAEQKSVATRKASGNCLNTIGPKLPELFGGSADLTGSNCTWWQGASVFDRDHHDGNYLHYGVREFAMFAVMNGIALHGGFIPYGGTFLTFVDYGRNAVRLAALMQQKAIFVLTHDSIGLGEDGPTHQPIEHVSMLRATPGVHTWRPADSTETAIAWQAAIEYQGPSCLCLTRQNLPQQAHTIEQLADIHRGGYVLKDCDGDAELILIATGSEIELAMAAAEQLTAQDTAVRVVSMPCLDLFIQQPADYQTAVLPPACSRRIAIEAGSPDSWYTITGLKGKVIGIQRFGVSAPYQEAYQELGITTEKLLETASQLLLEPCQA